jgi:hypothetical protein
MFSGHIFVSTSNLTTCRLRLKSSINPARMSLVILSHSNSFRPSFLQPARQPNFAKFISNCSRFQSLSITLYNWSHRLQYFFIFRSSTVLQASQECRPRAERQAAGRWGQQRRRRWRTDEGSRCCIANTKVLHIRTGSETTSFVEKLTAANFTQIFRFIWWNSQAVERPSRTAESKGQQNGSGEGKTNISNAERKNALKMY